MKNTLLIMSLVVVGGALWPGISDGGKGKVKVKLPQAQAKGKMSLEETIARRRSRRSYSSKELTLEQVAQIVWCAQGTTEVRGAKRASPSAGATYPLEVFLAVGKGGVKGMEEGLYRYVPSEHALEQTGDSDVRGSVAAAALNQRFLAEAPVDVLIAADYKRTTRRYGKRGIRYVHIEVGHVGENIYLQAEALGLGTVAVGAFDDDDVAKAFDLPSNLVPLYLMPIGYAR